MSELETQVFVPELEEPVEQGLETIVGDVALAATVPPRELLPIERCQPLRSHSRGDDSVGWYLDRIGTYPLLKREELTALSQTVEAGLVARKALASDNEHEAESRGAYERAVKRGETAKQRLMECNLRLVVSWAKKYPVPPGMELLDLIQEGNLGLEHAIEKYDWRKGFAFSTYASVWIRQSIGRAVATKGNLIYVPQDRQIAARAAFREFEESGDPSVLSDEDILVASRLDTYSLNYETTEDGAELQDVIADLSPSVESTVIRAETKHVLAQVFDEMLKREDLDKRIVPAVTLRFGLAEGTDKLTQNQVAEQMKISADAVRRLLKKAQTYMVDHQDTELIEALRANA